MPLPGCIPRSRYARAETSPRVCLGRWLASRPRVPTSFSCELLLVECDPPDHLTETGRAGRGRERRIGKTGDAVLPHALRGLEHLGLRLLGGVCPTGSAAWQQLGAC